jgi:hypothetical protein
VEGVDFIFHSSALAVVSTLDAYTVEELCEAGGIPNSQVGADHLLIKARFRYV